MKIIQVVEKLDVGGLERIVMDLSNNLSEKHKVLIISLQDFDKKKIKKWIKINENVEVLSLFKNKESNNALSIFKTILKMRSLILNFKPDVVHSHHLGPLLYSTLSTLGLKVKIIHTEHDVWYLNNKKSFFIRKSLSFIKKHKTIALTKKMEKVLNNKFKIKNTDIIFNGINFENLNYIDNA